MRHLLAFALLPLWISLLAGSTRATPAENERSDSATDPSAGELLQKVVDRELAAAKQDQSLWMYESRTQTQGAQTAKEVIETHQGNLSRTVWLQGQPLTKQQQAREDQRVREIATNPWKLRKMRREQAHDGQQAEQLLSILPKALDLSYGDRHGDLVQLNFRPNPRFHPSSREAQVFRAMAGTIWVNAKEDRLAEIDGHLIQRVNFGGGLLGHLDKGGEFHVTQSEVGPAHWDVTDLRVNMRGKALFFKTIGVQQNERRSDFKRVPGNLTLAQAAQRLDEQGRPQTAGRSTAAATFAQK